MAKTTEMIEALPLSVSNSALTSSERAAESCDCTFCMAICWFASLHSGERALIAVANCSLSKTSIRPTLISTLVLDLAFFLATGNAANCAKSAVFCPNMCHILSTPLVKQCSRVVFSNAVKSSFHSPLFNCLFINNTANLKACDSDLSATIASLSGSQSMADFGELPRFLRRIMRWFLGVETSSSSPGISVSSSAKVSILRHFFSIISQSADFATLALRCCLGMFVLKAISRQFETCSSCKPDASYIIAAKSDAIQLTGTVKAKIS